MPPYSTSATTVSTLEYEDDVRCIDIKRIPTQEILEAPHISDFKEFLSKLKWFNIILITTVHAVFFWGLFAYPYRKSLDLILFNYTLGIFSGIGVSIGVHRYWAHRSFKAKTPLRIFLLFCYCLAGHNRIFNWVRDHRVHHRFTDTDADPHNSNRGFFFAHVGWLMIEKHPEVKRRGKEIDMSDILADPLIQFQQKYYIPLVLTIGFILPTIIPPLCWGQSWIWSFLSTFVGRYCILLNSTWLVNSAAHVWGTKPYDKRISARENISVGLITMGEGWQNYHHMFPWSYKAGEFGPYLLHFSACIIDFFAHVGWAYDLKSPSPQLIKKAVQRTGDGTHILYGDMEIPEYEFFNNEDNVISKTD